MVARGGGGRGAEPPGDGDDVGTVSRMVWKSLLPYRVEFEVTTTRVEHPHLLEGDAVGELEGIGRWRLYEQDGRHRRPLRVERDDDEAVDEPAWRRCCARPSSGTTTG